MDIAPIEEMQNLKARLGESGTDRIRYAGRTNIHRQRGSTNINNTVLEQMQPLKPNTRGCKVNDFITAAAHLYPQQSRPLNINRLFNILQSMETINTREVIKMTNLQPRQAQKYVRAVKFALPFIERAFRTGDLGIAHEMLSDSDLPLLESRTTEESRGPPRCPQPSSTSIQRTTSR